MALKLRELLDAHDRSLRADSIEANIGDGFLFEHNSLFRNLREAAVAAGASFSTRDDLGYHTCPHIALPDVLGSRTITLGPTAHVLRKIERARPGLFTLPELPFIKPNFILHESAHFVADLALPQVHRDGQRKGNRERAVLLILLAESYATACEILANLYANTPIHAAFSDFNVQRSVLDVEDYRKTVLRSVEAIGFPLTFKMVCLSYLFWNFGYDRLTPKGISQLMEFSGSSLPAAKSTARTVQRLSDYCFQMNRKFRTQTADFYFKFLGFTHDIENLVDFNFLKLLNGDARIRESWEDLVDLADRGSSSRTFSRLADLRASLPAKARVA
jgi:hypothetical protein